MLALLILPVLPLARFLYSKQLTTEQQKWTSREIQEYEWEQKLPIHNSHFPRENHYVQSKNIILFAPKPACERVITSAACGNRHLCSFFICHFGVYFQKNWKIIFKICPPPQIDWALTDQMMLTGSPSQWSCKSFLLYVYRMIWNYSDYLKNLKSLVQFTGLIAHISFK